MKSVKKKFIKSFFVLLFFIFFFSPLSLEAQVNPNQSEQTTGVSRDSQTGAFFRESGYSGASANSIIGSIIKTVLSLLGIVFLVLMIFSGYQWMTAGGNEDQVTQAKSRIKNAIIGVVVVIMAYAITAFVFKSLPGGSSSQTQGGTTGTQN
jgi:ABC-type multidrug transport system permease subunit